MRLTSPFEISARLMPAVRVGDAYLSLDLSGRQSSDGRDIYEAYIDLPDGTEHAITDLRSGCQGGSVREGMAAFLSFLSAAGEAWRYRESTGDCSDNVDLFSPAIVEWASAYSDELSLLECEIEENPDCIDEDDE